MSVSSMLAFVLAGAAVKNRRADRPDKIAALNAEIAALKVDLADARRDRDQARADLKAYERQASERASRVALEALQAARPAGPDFRPPHIAQMQQAALLQQAQAQHYQAAQNYNSLLNQQHFAQQAQLGQAMRLLGAQSLINAELWCNCVPARHDLFLRGE